MASSSHTCTNSQSAHVILLFTSLPVGCLLYKSLTDSITDIEVCTLSCSHIYENKETWLLLDCAAHPLYCLMILSWSEKITSEIQVGRFDVTHS